MPISPRTFLRQNVTFPRNVSNLLINPNNYIYQKYPLTSGPNTLITGDEYVERRVGTPVFSTPKKSGLNGGFIGVRSRSIT